MLTLTSFIWFRNSFSIISGIWELLKNGEVLIFVLVFSVSVVLSIIKIGFMYRVLSSTQSNTPELLRYLQLMHDYGRWAMLDVMVVAVLFFTVNLGAIASVQAHSGLYVFALAVGSSVTAYSYLPAGIDLVSNLDNSINSLLLVTVAFLSGALLVR